MREYYTLRETIKDILTTQNTGLTLIENIENDLYKVNDIEWCSVKLINRRVLYAYSIKVSGEDSVIEHEKDMQKHTSLFRKCKRGREMERTG